MTACKSGAWTEEEDQLLTKFQAVYGNKWSLVSQHIPGRNGQQCAQRWRHKVNPNIVRDKWTPEEDSILVTLVGELGVGKWASVARHLPGRTDQQCMGRWRRHLDPNIRKDAWTAEEDEQLQALYAEYGPSWSCIAKRIANRTPQQCRGRWCILSGCSKSKAAAPTAPETPHPDRARSNRKGPGAIAIAPAATIRGFGQVCPSTVSRRGAVTETPAMPASAVAPTPLETLPPPTVQRTRRFQAVARASMAGVPEQEDAIEERAKASVRHSCRRLRIDPGRLLADAETEGAVAKEEQVQEQGKEGVAGLGPVLKGRLQLGSRLVAFRTRPRTTRYRPRSRLIAILLSPAAGTSSKGCPRQRESASAAVAAVALLSPPRGPLALLDEIEEEEAAMLSGLLDDDEEGQVVSAENQGSRDCAAPTRSTSHGGCASASVVYTPDDALLSLSTRITRSGRCYPLTCSNPGGSASQRRRQRAHAATSTQTEEEHKAATAAMAAGAAVTSTATVAANGLEADGPRPPSCAQGQGNDGHETHVLRPTSQQAEGGVVDGIAAQDFALLPPGEPVEAAFLGVDVAGPADQPFNGVGSPLQAAGHGLTGHLLSGGSTCSSFGIPEHLLGDGQLGPAADQPADWQQVGSPPTSSLLALLQAGLLQTPTGTPGASPGPSALRAPIVPGMPQVTPGFSHEWSDVPALSWSEWRNCKGGFGIIAQHPAADGHGTPDNTQTAPRTQGPCGASVTPRRDMFVRPMGFAAGCPQPELQAHDAEAMGESEGQGTTHPAVASPSSSHQGRGRTRRASADEAVLQRNASMCLAAGGSRNGTTAGAAAGLTPMAAAYAGFSPCRLTVGPRGKVLPDFCSPSKKQRMVGFESGFGYASSLPAPRLTTTQAAAPRQGDHVPSSVIMGFSVVRPTGHAGRPPSGVGCAHDLGMSAAALPCLPKLELPKSNAAMAGLRGALCMPPATLGGLPPPPIMPPPLPLPSARQLPPITHVPMPTALANALMAAPLPNGCPANNVTVPIHQRFATATAPDHQSQLVVGSLPASLEALPRLALPRFAAPAPQQRLLPSIFPVLNPIEYGTDK